MTPLRFFHDSEKTAARSAAKFGTPYLASVPHIVCKKSTPGHLRSGHQVKSKRPTSEKSLNSRQSYNNEAIGMKLPEVSKSDTTYKTYVLDFRYM